MHRLLAVALVFALTAPYSALALPPLEGQPDNPGSFEPTQDELQWITDHGKEIDGWLATAAATPRETIGWTMFLAENADGKGCTEEWSTSSLEFPRLIELLAQADVVLIGEQHDDPATHRLELDIFHALHAARGEHIALAMEMFERDVQWSLDNYTTAGQMGSGLEKYLLANSRPWPSYATDYRPLVEYARWHMIRAYGSNAPTELARRVAKEGLDPVLASLTPEQRGWLAAETTAPKDAYWQKFLEAMGGGGSASTEAHGKDMTEDQVFGFYVSQCLKDDTMAESIARLREADPTRQVVHLSGSFHVDYHLGTASRVAQRRPGDRIVTVAIRPLADLEPATVGAALDAEQGVADYVVFVPQEAAPAGGAS